MAHDTKRHVLLQALQVIGDHECLATKLGASRIQLESWLSGFTELPDKFFLRAVDLLLEDGIPGPTDEQTQARRH
jgi:hypothetical protein